jgi:hypothetical protein
MTSLVILELSGYKIHMKVAASLSQLSHETALAASLRLTLCQRSAAGHCSTDSVMQIARRVQYI